jgi:hypothetical protein
MIGRLGVLIGPLRAMVPLTIRIFTLPILLLQMANIASAQV